MLHQSTIRRSNLLAFATNIVNDVNLREVRYNGLMRVHLIEIILNNFLEFNNLLKSLISYSLSLSFSR